MNFACTIKWENNILWKGVLKKDGGYMRHQCSHFSVLCCTVVGTASGITASSTNNSQCLIKLIAVARKCGKSLCCITFFLSPTKQLYKMHPIDNFSDEETLREKFPAYNTTCPKQYSCNLKPYLFYQRFQHVPAPFPSLVIAVKYYFL